MVIRFHHGQAYPIFVSVVSYHGSLASYQRVWSFLLFRCAQVTHKSTKEKETGPVPQSMLQANSKGSNTIKSISNDDQTDDPHGKKRKKGYRNMNFQNFHQQMFPNWTGKMDFLKAQAQVAAILVIAAIGNLWPIAYKRNDNHNPTMFWVMNAGLLVASILTLKHDKEGSARGVQLLSRPQTEEWKGWMQWAFIMVRVICACLR
jgi:hypothetical protein